MATLREAGRSLVAEYAGFQRAVYVVGAGQFVNVFGGGVVYPFAALYFVETVGLPFSLVGVGLLANAVARAVGTAVGGVTADRTGRVPTMVASMALSAVEVSKRLGFGVGNLVGGAFFDAGLEPWLWPAMVAVALGIGIGLLALERRLTPAENGVVAA